MKLFFFPQNLVALVEGGRGVVWADQREKVKIEEVRHCSDVVALSPLTEPDRFEVPPTSVLRQSFNPNTMESVKTTKPNLDATVVLQPVDLDSTFDVQNVPEESTHFLSKVSFHQRCDPKVFEHGFTIFLTTVAIFPGGCTFVTHAACRSDNEYPSSNDTSEPL